MGNFAAHFAMEQQERYGTGLGRKTVTKHGVVRASADWNYHGRISGRTTVAACLSFLARVLKRLAEIHD